MTMTAIGGIISVSNSFGLRISLPKCVVIFLVISLFKISSGIFKNLSHLVFMNICLNSKAAKTLCAMRLLFLIELSAAGDYTMSFFVSTVPFEARFFVSFLLSPFPAFV